MCIILIQLINSAKQLILLGISLLQKYCVRVRFVRRRIWKTEGWRGRDNCFPNRKYHGNSFLYSESMYNISSSVWMCVDEESAVSSSLQKASLSHKNSQPYFIFNLDSWRKRVNLFLEHQYYYVYLCVTLRGFLSLCVVCVCVCVCVCVE